MTCYKNKKEINSFLTILSSISRSISHNFESFSIKLCFLPPAFSFKARSVIEYSIAVCTIVFPIALIYFSCGTDEAALAWSFIGFPKSFIDRSVLKYCNSSSFSLVIWFVPLAEVVWRVIALCENAHLQICFRETRRFDIRWPLHKINQHFTATLTLISKIIEI